MAMNVPLFVDTRRPELERFLPMLFQTVGSRQGRSLYRRPSSGNMPTSVSVLRFIRRLPKYAIRRRQPVLKFCRRKRHTQIWSARIRQTHLTEKQSVQLNVLSRRLEHKKRRRRGGVQRRSMQRRQRLVRGVRLPPAGAPHAQQQLLRGASIKRKKVPQPSTTLILPSHAWMARRFRYHRDVVRVPQDAPDAATDTLLATTNVASSVPVTVGAADTNVCRRGTSGVVDYRLAVPISCNMKQFRRVVAATAAPPSCSSSSYGPPRRSVLVGLLTDESHHHIYRIRIAAVCGATASSSSALEASVPSPPSLGRLSVVAALQRAFGLLLAGPAAPLQTELEDVVRAVVMGASGWVACDVHFPQRRIHHRIADSGSSCVDDEDGMAFLVVSSSAACEAQVLHSKLLASSTSPIAVVCNEAGSLGAQVLVSATPTTLWDPRRTPTHTTTTTQDVDAAQPSPGNQYQRTGLLCVTCHASVADAVAKSVNDVIAGASESPSVHPRRGVSVPMCIVTSIVFEASAAQQDPCTTEGDADATRRSGAAALARLWIFVVNQGCQMVVAPSTQHPSSSGGVAGTKESAGTKIQSPRRVDLQESVREAVFRATRQLFRRLMMSTFGSHSVQDPLPHGKLVCAGRNELQLVYRIHGIPSPLNRDFSPEGFQWSATASGLLPDWWSAPHGSMTAEGSNRWRQFRLLQFVGKGTKSLMKRGDVVVSVEFIQSQRRKKQNGQQAASSNALKDVVHVQPIGVVTSCETSCVFAGRRTAIAYWWDAAASCGESSSTFDPTRIVVVMSAVSARRLGVLAEWTSASKSRTEARALHKRSREGGDDGPPAWLCDLDVCREVRVV